MHTAMWNNVVEKNNDTFVLRYIKKESKKGCITLMYLHFKDITYLT
jgi:hypothetical protein